MTTNYKLIAKERLSSSATSITFSSIPSTYTDLLVVVSGRSDRASAYEDTCRVRFNSDSGANYTTRMLYSYNNSLGFETAAAQTGIKATGSFAAALTTTNVFGSASFYVTNYAGSAAKSLAATAVSEQSGTQGINCISVGLWSGTSAISSIQITPWFGTNLVSGTSAYLYGIFKA